MGKALTLTASDGHRLSAYRADSAQAPKGGIVVIQEIFGVNHHIRAVCDRIAAAGYTAIAPTLFDRIEAGFESGYSPAEINDAMRFVENPDFAAFLKDSAAAIEAIKSEGPVSIMGFCLGGTVAYAAACNLPGLASAVCYYGGHIVHMIDRQPICPTLMHFGSLDQHIPQADVAKIKAACTACEIHIYEDADHGFNCDERGSYNENAAELAWKRTLDFLARHGTNG